MKWFRKIWRKLSNRSKLCIPEYKCSQCGDTDIHEHVLETGNSCFKCGNGHYVVWEDGTPITLKQGQGVLDLLELNTDGKMKSNIEKVYINKLNIEKLTSNT